MQNSSLASRVGFTGSATGFPLCVRSMHRRDAGSRPAGCRSHRLDPPTTAAQYHTTRPISVAGGMARRPGTRFPGFCHFSTNRGTSFGKEGSKRTPPIVPLAYRRERPIISPSRLTTGPPPIIVAMSTDQRRPQSIMHQTGATASRRVVSRRFQDNAFQLPSRLTSDLLMAGRRWKESLAR